MTYALCCVGHITVDKIVTPKATVFLPGGTSYYFSCALAGFNLPYVLVTSLAEADRNFVADLQNRGVSVVTYASPHTMHFENRYGDDPDHRTQRVLHEAAHFTLRQVGGINAEIVHLGPLLSGDMPDDLIVSLGRRSKLSLDVQGLLRRVEDSRVVAVDWTGKKDVLPYVHFLKANEEELAVLTGCTDVEAGAKAIAGWGVKEVIVTRGSKGSVIYADERFHPVPAYAPKVIADATGCGDTYMAGYLYRRLDGAGIGDAGQFAAAMATVKIQAAGPFSGTKEDVMQVVVDGNRRREGV